MLLYTMYVSKLLSSLYLQQMQQKPRVVKRGMDEFDISDGEPEKVDHLLFLVHGIGQFCDLKFRNVTEVGKFTRLVV